MARVKVITAPLDAAYAEAPGPPPSRPAELNRPAAVPRVARGERPTGAFRCERLSPDPMSRRIQAWLVLLAIAGLLASAAATSPPRR